MYSPDDRMLLVVNQSGKIRELFVPFRVQRINPIGNIQANTLVFAEQVMHEQVNY
jgi:hypothetical protein